MKIKTSSRTCFAIDYYDDPEEAAAAADRVLAKAETYNGGFYHGMPCGRDAGYDYTDEDGTKLFAVTRA